MKTTDLFKLQVIGLSGGKHLDGFMPEEFSVTLLKICSASKTKGLSCQSRQIRSESDLNCPI